MDRTLVLEKTRTFVPADRVQRDLDMRKQSHAVHTSVASAGRWSELAVACYRAMLSNMQRPLVHAIRAMTEANPLEYSVWELPLWDRLELLDATLPYESGEGGYWRSWTGCEKPQYLSSVTA